MCTLNQNERGRETRCTFWQRLSHCSTPGQKLSKKRSHSMPHWFTRECADAAFLPEGEEEEDASSFASPSASLQDWSFHFLESVKSLLPRQIRGFHPGLSLTYGTMPLCSAYLAPFTTYR